MDNILGFIGLAKRAGKVSAGEFICSKSIKDRSAKLIVIAQDASENTKKTLMDSCRHYRVEYLLFSDKDHLGQYTGGGSKAVISINDENFAKSLKEKIQGTAEGKDR